MDAQTVKELQVFKEKTEAERVEIGNRLLSPLNEVYEIDFGPVIGKLCFRRMNLEDRARLVESAKDYDSNVEVSAELLEKHSADGIKKQTWLDMVQKDPAKPETGERSAEFSRIVLNLTALSVGGSEDGMMEFFRALETRIRDRGTLPIPTPDSTGTAADGL